MLVLALIPVLALVALVKVAPVHASASTMWGIDTTDDVQTLGDIQSTQSTLGATPQFVGRYLIWNNDLTTSEASYIRHMGIRILLLDSPNQDFGAAGNDPQQAGINDAQQAIAQAHSIGVPPGTAIFRDVEGSSTITSTYILAYYAAFQGSNFVAGFYENPYSPLHSFGSAYCGAVSQNPAIGSTPLYSSEPENDVSGQPYSPYASQAPPWAAPPPATPGCANSTVAWQYLEQGIGTWPSSAPNVDVDEFNPAYKDLLWGADVGPPVAVVTPDGGQKLLFWAGATDHHLYEAWYTFSTGQWSGPVDMTGMLSVPSGGYLASAPTVLFTPDGGQQLVFWQGANGDLWEAWYTYATFSWNVQDLTAAHGLQGAGGVASAPTVTITPGGGQQLVFWQGTNHDLWEAWYTVATFSWSSQDLSTGLLGGAGRGTLGSAPSVILTPGGGQQLTFWEGTNNDVWEAWYTVATYTWNVQDLSAARFPGAAAVASAPDVLLTPDAGQQLLFYRAAGTGDLWEAWYTVATFTWNAQDLTTSQLGGLGSMTSGPVALITPGGGQQLVFWQTTSLHLDEAWYTVSTSSWAAQDISAGAGLPGGAGLASSPSVMLLGNSEQDVWWLGADNSLWELLYDGAWTYVG
jgi:hypothetical protein